MLSTKLDEKRFFRGVLSLLLIGLMMLTTVYFAMASISVDSALSLPNGAGESGLLQSVATQGNKYAGGKTILKYNSTTCVLTFSNKLYSELEYDEKVSFMEDTLSYITKASFSGQTKSRVYNFIASQDSTITNAMKYLSADANADFIEAKKWFDPFTGVVGVIMGVLALMIFTSLGLSIMMDISYLTLPMIRVALEREDNSRRPLFVSNEAWKTVLEVERAGGSKTLLGVYLKKRVVMILVLAICLGYLLSGRIYSAIIYIMDAFNI